MRRAIAFLCLMSAASPALAISSYQSGAYSCASIQQIIAEQHAVVLRYSSRSGIGLYDRYVSGDEQCRPAGFAALGSVPTKDRSNCPVYRCRSNSVFNPK